MRAEVTEIAGDRIFDNNGTAGYSIDLPNGGQATVTGNVIEQGPNSENSNIIAYGEEGSLHATDSLAMSANTVLNDLGKGTLLWDGSGSAATMDGTRVWGLSAGQLVNGSDVTVTNTTSLSSEPALDTSSPWSATGSATTGNVVSGTSGDDVLVGQLGSPNTLHGGAGNDSITGGDQFDNINGNQGDDTIVGRSATGDWLLGGQGNDSIDASASAAHNIINGNIGADTLTGGGGGDTLRGGQGDDLIHGGSGADWISGDLGQNTLTGGLGADTFHASANGGVSLVADFNGGEGDRIQLDSGATYHLSQQGQDLHIVLDSGQGGDVVLQNTSQQAFQSSWIFER